MNEFCNTVYRLISEVHPQPVAFTDDSRLIEDLQFDCLDFVTLALAIEFEFGIDLSDEHAMLCETVRDVMEVVDALYAMARNERFPS